jgi:hypothetical protein
MTIAIVWGEKHEVNRKNDTVLTIVIFSCESPDYLYRLGGDSSEIVL